MCFPVFSSSERVHITHLLPEESNTETLIILLTVCKSHNLQTIKTNFLHLFPVESAGSKLVSIDPL